MSDYDRFANARYGAGLARSGAGAIDQGLRAYMIGVYNYMTLGLGLTGVVAFVAYQARRGRIGERPYRRADPVRPGDLRLAAALGGDLRAARAGVRDLGRPKLDVGRAPRARCSSPSRR